MCKIYENYPSIYICQNSQNMKLNTSRLQIQSFYLVVSAKTIRSSGDLKVTYIFCHNIFPFFYLILFQNKNKKKIKKKLPHLFLLQPNYVLTLYVFT